MNNVKGKTQYISSGYVGDIDVDPNVDTVVFEASVNNVILRDVKKQFPNVKHLVLNGDATTFKISNYLFPNIENVVSNSRSYRSGPCLIRGNTLLNSFCKSPDAKIDLEDVHVVEDYALEGCMAEVTKIADYTVFRPHALDGYAGRISPIGENGVSCIGDLIIGIDEEAEDLYIPENVKYVLNGVNLPSNRNIHVASIKPLKNFFTRWPLVPMKLWLNVDNSISAVEDIMSILEENSRAAISEITVAENPFCKSIDGILYSKDGTSLIYCPRQRAEPVTVPEGVTSIGKEAFCRSVVSAVKLPKTLRTIGEGAFRKCFSLTQVNFQEGITEIDAYAFAGCQSLKKVNLPSTVKNISEAAFSECFSLESVELEEGLEKIEALAFDGSSALKSLSIPETVKKMGTRACPSLDRVYLHSEKIPEGFFRAICKSPDCIREDEIRVIECSLRSGRKFFVPAFITKLDAIDSRAQAFGDTCNLLDFMYEYAPVKWEKYEAAFRTYHETRRIEVGRYLKRVAKNIADRMLQEGREDDLIEFVKLDLASNTTLKYIVDKANSMRMLTLATYALDKIEKNTGSFRL